MTIKNVCVYCGSSNHVDDSFKQIAASTAATLAEHGYNIVYGGGRVGLMGIVADTAMANGAKVIGVIPEHLRNLEVQHDGLTELHVVDNMHNRKRMLFDRSDIFLILPGGLGTLDEAFEVLTLKQIGIHNKPIIIYNFDHYWDPLLQLINHVSEKGFAPPHSNEFKVVCDEPSLLDALTSVPEQMKDPALKWI